MRNNNTLKITIMALAIALNFIGGLIAISLKLPIYFDSIGTVLVGFLFGVVPAILTGVVSYIVNYRTFDPCALYFIPAQIIIALCSGIFYRRGLFNGKKSILGIILMAIPVSFVSACIAAYVFGGVTSAGSAIIVGILGNNGISMVLGVFLTQIVTDLLDKILIVYLVLAAIKVIPRDIKNKITAV